MNNEEKNYEVDGFNIDYDEERNLEKARKLINNRSLVKYKITNDDLNIVFDLKALESQMGIVVGNVKFKEVEWVYESDLYGTGQTPPTKKPKKRNKVNEIFDYLFGKFNEVTGETEAVNKPSLSIDSLIDKALSKITTDLSYYEDPFWTAEEEEKEISKSLHDEASKLTPPKENKNDEISGWVRVAWPDKSITTIEHVTFLEELGSEEEAND